ncbi:MltA domain-containing protein [Roseiarcaceae bacterium H3SJ34-1]|uniref:murein transglycosylase A n=1 Tax=Terripilifer ovatus TaxID=3032367 RepID=UPI003AB93CE5|nr:MltA domain-containing protein [Roseiarcaceae bacterium H3SJ34-1]
MSGATSETSLADGLIVSELSGKAVLQEVSFDDLRGFADDDHLAAWKTFQKSCDHSLAGVAAVRVGAVPSPAFLQLCSAVEKLPPPGTAAEARQRFQAFFKPYRIAPVPGANPYDVGFLTGYYEPEVAGSLWRTPEFSEPILSLPDDIAYASTNAADAPAILPTRGEIDGGALNGRAKPVVFVRDGIEAFMIQVQGSARIRLSDGTLVRLAYAGRNGHPYTSIGKALVDEGQILMGDMSLNRLKAWVRDKGQEADAAGRRLMQRNRSYVFFKRSDTLSPDQGPVGAEGVELTPLRSIAVDRTLWAYGLPFWIDADLPAAEGGTAPLRRLMIAQDTGTAIVGAARADIFYGTGDEAGIAAGNIRHRGTLTVLLPCTGSAP